MNYCIDLILGKAFCIFIFFHFPDSRLSVLNSLHFYFSLRDSAIREYRKIPNISPSKIIEAPQSGNAKNPPLNRPSKYKPPGGLSLENCPQIQSKTKQKR